ncbi:integrator complex subunit 5 [Copidosoma floridanum]|uniref:integrator complex subunit 5 n=1 Tax=Copidosoma floridanum TaxID=29053 RepID=UPI0006C96AA3|nr:integrator complex subunit 5 [Copidosoma floridanum]
MILTEELSLTALDASVEVKKFISGCAKHSQMSNSYEITQAALKLMRNVPALKESVLEHFCSVFSVAVNKHLRQIEIRQHSVTPTLEEAIIREIYLVLESFVKSNAEAWAPIILDWSLKLLGNLCSDYSKHVNVSVNLKLQDYLQCWMSCQAIRTLVDLSAQCLQSQMYSNPKCCVKTMFNISKVHSPHFDWVIAHIGSCFPNVFIPKILSWGLKDYTTMSVPVECEDKKNEGRLRSLVGILNHLASYHFSVIRISLLDLFKLSLTEHTTNVNKDLKKTVLATVPFLLNLTSYSPILFKVLTDDLLKLVRSDIISKFAIYWKDWKKYFNYDMACLTENIVSLVLNCCQGAFQIINILLDTSLNSNVGDYEDLSTCKNVKSGSREILESILKNAESIARTDHSKMNNSLLLISIRQDLPNILLLLLSHEPLRIKTGMRLLSLLGVQNYNILVSATTYLLQKASTNYQLALLVRFVIDNIINLSKKFKNENVTSCIGYFTQVVEESIREAQCAKKIDNSAVCQLFSNVSILLKWENSGLVPCMESKFISQAVTANLLHITKYLNKTNDFDLASDIVEILSNLELSKDGYSTEVEVILKLTKAAIRYFDMCLAENDVAKKERGVRMISCFLRGLIKCFQFARVLALREILEVAIFSENAKFFGTQERNRFIFTEESLSQQNHKQGSGTILAQRHSCVFHAGIIGHGPRKSDAHNIINREYIVLNSMLLVDLIKACSNYSYFKQYPVDIDSVNLLSLLLVELISSDVMYNGLPWPDEEFSKVTVERDLQIRRSFKDAPVLWTLLQLTAWYRPALAYCSVLLRAIIATILANCSTCKGTIITSVMALGQLLPPPLPTIVDVLPVLKPYQSLLVPLSSLATEINLLL